MDHVFVNGATVWEEMSLTDLVHCRASGTAKLSWIKSLSGSLQRAAYVFEPDLEISRAGCIIVLILITDHYMSTDSGKKKKLIYSC